MTEREVLNPCSLRCAGRIIVVGGMSGSRQRLNTVAAYDPREGLWQVGAVISSALHHQLFASAGYRRGYIEVWLFRAEMQCAVLMLCYFDSVSPC